MAATLPKFKDKVIHWTADDTQYSYPVSTSYKGILRLSPNDEVSLKEAQPKNILGVEVEKGTYSIDPIDKYIAEQFVRVSTSDGYLMDMRMTATDLEFDNLYVRGPLQTNSLRIYSDEKDVLQMSKVNYLPDQANTAVGALIGADDKILQDLTDPDEAHQPYLLVSHGLDERRFAYEEFNALVEETIMQTLMDVCSVATGSIIYAPITLKQYEAMLLKGRPNNYYQLDGKTENPSLIRDYLICDGSLYNNKDFPELAKILYNEKIIYWKYSAEKKMMVQETWVNDYKDHKWFRVPDLRHQFLRSVIPTMEAADDPSNQAGNWNVDVRPKYAYGKKSDQHVHFIASGFYTGKYKSTNFKDVENNGTVTDYAGILAPTSGDISWWGDRVYGGYRMWGGGGRYSGYRCRQGTGVYWTGLSSCSYTLSIPYKYNYQQPDSIIPDVGMSSENFISTVNDPESEDEISYNEREDYVDILEDNKALYGMENAPEHYCALPLIRI